jgi:hypothetical protein
VADWQTWTVPQDLAQLSVAVATTFVASDGEPAAFATAAEALAATEALRRAQPDAVIAIHVADREGPGAARARRLREIGRRGQTLVSAAAAALPAAGGFLFTTSASTACATSRCRSACSRSARQATSR